MANSLLDGPPQKQESRAVVYIARFFICSGVYLGLIGLVMLFFPAWLSIDWVIRLTRPLLTGLELGGPYYVFTAGWLFLFIGLELRDRRPWARWGAVAVCFVGIVLSVPIVSMASRALLSLLGSGLGIVVRVAVALLLVQEPYQIGT